MPNSPEVNQSNRLLIEKKLNHSLWSVYIISFCGDFLFGAVTFATLLLAESLGASDQNMGLISASYGISYCIFPFVIGRLSDKIGRKTSIIICFVIFSIITLVFVFATKIWHLIFGFIMVGVSLSFLWPAVSSLIVELSCLETKAKNLDRYMMSWGIGSIVGPFLSGIIYEFSGPRNTFLNLTLICVICLIVVIRYLHYPSYPNELLSDTQKACLNKENKLHADSEPNAMNDELEINKKSKNSKEKLENIDNDVFLMNLPSKTKRLFYLFAFSMIFFSAVYLIILSGYYVGYLAKYTELSPTWIGIIVFCLPIGRAIAFMLMKNFSTSVKLNFMILLAGVSFVLMFTIYLQENIFVLMLSLLILGFISGFSFSGGIALISSITLKRKGLYNGIAEGLVGIAFVVTPILPFVFLGNSANSPFIFIQILIILIFVGFIISRYLIYRNK
jgi:MFS family permease